MARIDLGLQSDEFYELTPRQLDALIKRQERATWNTEFMLAQLTSCVVNFSMSHPKKALEARDFMPSEWAKNPPVEKKPKRRKRQLIATEIRATMENWMKNARG
jgi:hypothetical protein